MELSPFHFTGRRKRQVTPVSSPVTRSGRVRRSTAGLLGEPAHAKSSHANEVRQDLNETLYADMYTCIIGTHTSTHASAHVHELDSLPHGTNQDEAGLETATMCCVGV